MSMDSAIDQLCRLQAIDKQLYRLKADQKAKPEELQAAQQRLEQQKTVVQQAEQAVKNLQLTQKEKEVELQTKEQQVQKLQGQLFQLKTNKEYTAMQQEIAGLKADNSLIEDAILQVLDQVEAAQQKRGEERAKLDQVQADFDAEKKRIESEIDEIEGKIGELERDRKTFVPDIPGEFLTAYERILVNRAGVAIVPLDGESCGGCFRRLPPQVINQVFIKAELITCESCGRILYKGEPVAES